MVFAAEFQFIAKALHPVSIPSRGLWFLRLGVALAPMGFMMFQSLVGVYGFCGRRRLRRSRRRTSFNP